MSNPAPRSMPTTAAMQQSSRPTSAAIRQSSRPDAGGPNAAAAVETGEDSLMSIRAMCEAFDVTPRALRFYEASELLAPLRRGQARLYGRRDRARLVLILRGKRFGFSLEQIRQLLDLYDPGDRNRMQTEATLAIARDRLADMQRQHAELSVAIDDLSRQIADAEAGMAASKPPAA